MTKPQRMVYQTTETRNRILEQAKYHFAEFGFFDAQMKDIAEAVGMSRHTLYRYFQNKMDLGFAILESIVKRHGENLAIEVGGLIEERDKPALERLTLVLRKAFLNIGDERELRFMAEFDGYFSTTRAPDDFREKVTSFFQRDVLELIEQLFEQGQVDGSLEPNQDYRQKMLATFEALYALQLRLALRGDLLVSLRPGEADALSEQLLELLIRGLANHNRGQA